MPRNNCEDLSWCWSILRKTFDGKKVVESAILVQTEVSHPHVLLTSLLHQHEYGLQCEVHNSATLLLFLQSDEDISTTHMLIKNCSIVETTDT